jgi:hypothetical protein
MAFGSMLDKAKETAKSAAESAGNVTNIVTDMVNDINSALPVLSEYGYKMNEFEVELGTIPSMKPHFTVGTDLAEGKEEEMLSKLEGNKIGSLIAKSLIQAKKLQGNIKIGQLEFAEIEIEASVPPKVTLKFQ